MKKYSAVTLVLGDGYRPKLLRLRRLYGRRTMADTLRALIDDKTSKILSMKTTADVSVKTDDAEEIHED